MPIIKYNKSLKKVTDIKKDFKTTDEPQYKVIRFSCREITILSIKDIVIDLEKAIFGGEIKNIVLDLEDVHYFDSSFIGYLLNVQKKLKVNNKQLFITSLNSRIFNLAVGGEIEQLFIVFSSPQDAVQNCM
ncbi:MAG: STAS domain-containing protein [Spirochaetes bacterium]|nr:STAS domain-containing protein [Spirochaetota bacterium]